MTDTAATVFGIYHVHVHKGRETQLTIALPDAEWERLQQDIGTHPTRAKKISLALTTGVAASALAGLLRRDEARDPVGAPATAAEPRPATLAGVDREPYHFGRAMKRIAHLAIRMSLLTDAANTSTNLQASTIAFEARDDADRDLAAAVEEFDERLRAALAGARP